MALLMIKGRPIDQVRNDLDELARNARWDGLDRPPLAIYLQNASDTAAGHPAAATISEARRAYLERVGASPASPVGFAPPPSLYRVVRLTAPIGDHHPEIAPGEIRAALDPGEVDVDELPLRFDRLPPLDGSPAPWQSAQDAITEEVRGYLRYTARRSGNPLALFGFAPIPLLAALGRAIGDKRRMMVFERHRHTDGWRWDTHPPAQSALTTLEEVRDAPAREIALLVSISDTVKRFAVRAAVGDADIFEICAETPRTNLIRTPDQLRDFSERWRQMLDRAHARRGASGARLHLFAAAPLSVSVELGRRLLPKADPPIVVYDYRQGRFLPALVLGPPLA